MPCFGSLQIDLDCRVARQVAIEPATEKLVSVASLWEIAIKVQLNKLEFGMEFEVLIKLIQDDALATVLPISPAHVMQLRRLEFHHRDPFDRMIAAQALTENIPLVSADAILEAYGVKRLW